MEDAYADEELEEIKRKKLEELRKRVEQERQRRAQIEAALRQIMTPEARERLANLRLVKPELAATLEEQLINLARTGRVKVPITDDFLKRLLAELYEQTHRETKIEIRRK